MDRTCEETADREHDLNMISILQTAFAMSDTKDDAEFRRLRKVAETKIVDGLSAAGVENPKALLSQMGSYCDPRSTRSRSNELFNEFVDNMSVFGCAIVGISLGLMVVCAVHVLWLVSQ